MNRSLDELTASELNDAIDDTNFPKARSTACLSRSNSDAPPQNGNTIHATSPLNGNDDNVTDDQTDSVDTQQSTTEPHSTMNGQNVIKGFIKRAHPAPLKMVAFKSDSIDVPGTPRTPRTSTTPGKCFIFYLKKIYNPSTFHFMKKRERERVSYLKL